VFAQLFFGASLVAPLGYTDEERLALDLDRVFGLHTLVPYLDAKRHSARGTVDELATTCEALAAARLSFEAPGARGPTPEERLGAALFADAATRRAWRDYYGAARFAALLRLLTSMLTVNPAERSTRGAAAVFAGMHCRAPAIAQTTLRPVPTPDFDEYADTQGLASRRVAQLIWNELDAPGAPPAGRALPRPRDMDAATRARTRAATMSLASKLEDDDYAALYASRGGGDDAAAARAKRARLGADEEDVMASIDFNPRLHTQTPALQLPPDHELDDPETPAALAAAAAFARRRGVLPLHEPRPPPGPPPPLPPPPPPPPPPPSAPRARRTSPRRHAASASPHAPARTAATVRPLLARRPSPKAKPADPRPH
jgi:hypothetical protein